MRGREQFKKYKVVIKIICGFYALFPVKVRKKLLEKHRYTRGKYGLAIRYSLLKSLALACGENVAIYTGVYLLHPENLRVGNNVSFQPMTYLECGDNRETGIQIGNDVSLAHGVTVLSVTHMYEDSNMPIRDVPVTAKKVCIGDNVWIGAKATVLCGVTIASGCVIGANAVVTKSTEPDKVYAGVPAKVIKERLQ